MFPSIPHATAKIAPSHAQINQSDTAELAQFLSIQAGLGEIDIAAIIEGLALQSEHHTMLADILSSSYVSSENTAWKGYDPSFQAGSIYRQLTEIGERSILCAFIRNAPGTSDKIAEEVEKFSKQGLLAQVTGLFARSERYQSLEQAYESALEASSFLCSQLAPFAYESVLKKPDHSRYLARGILQPIITLGHGLPSLLNNQPIRHLGAIIDQYRENELPRRLQELGMHGLEVKEIECIEHVLTIAAQKHARNIMVAKLSEESFAQVSASALPHEPNLPNALQHIGDDYMNRNDRVNVTNSSILGSVVRQGGRVVLTEEGLKTIGNPRYRGGNSESRSILTPYLPGKHDSAESLPIASTLSTSGRYCIARNNYSWMTEEARDRAQASEACFELYRLSDSLEQITYTSLEPLEGVWGSYKRERLIPHFSWRHSGREDYLVTCAADIPRCYVHHFDHQGNLTVQRFDLKGFDFDFQRRESAQRFIEAKLSPSMRWVVALAEVGDGTTISIFDREQYGDDPLLPVFSRYFPDTESAQPRHIEIGTHDEILLLSSEHAALGRIKARTDRNDIVKWTVLNLAECFYPPHSSLRALSPNGELIATICSSGKLVQYWDFQSLKLVNTLRFLLTPEERLTSIQFSPSGRDLVIGDNKGGVWTNPLVAYPTGQ